VNYRVEYTPRSNRQFRRLPVSVQRRLIPIIDALAVDPRPLGVKAVAGPEPLLRIRVGDYRVVYEVEDDVLIVLIVAVGHRRDVYRRVQ